MNEQVWLWVCVGTLVCVGACGDDLGVSDTGVAEDASTDAVDSAADAEEDASIECSRRCPGAARSGPPDTEEILVPGGVFERGCEEDDHRECFPRHAVELSAFYIDRYTVTVRRYQECVEDGGCTALVPYLFTLPGARPRATVDDVAQGNERIQVHGATHDQALAFCEWDEAELVTGAQWERAATGTHDRVIWPFTSDLTPDEDQWCEGMTMHLSCHPPTRALPRREEWEFDQDPDSQGSNGMANVFWFFEWTRDTRDPYAPATPPELDPVVTGPGGHDVRGSVAGLPVGASTRDVAARNVSVPRQSDFTPYEVASFRCSRLAGGAR